MNAEFIRIDPGLVRDVVKLTGISVKAKAIRRAIEEFLRDRKRKGLKNMAGKLRFYTQADLSRTRQDV